MTTLSAVMFIMSLMLFITSMVFIIISIKDNNEVSKLLKAARLQLDRCRELRLKMELEEKTKNSDFVN